MFPLPDFTDERYFPTYLKTPLYLPDASPQHSLSEHHFEPSDYGWPDLSKLLRHWCLFATVKSFQFTDEGFFMECQDRDLEVFIVNVWIPHEGPESDRRLADFQYRVQLCVLYYLPLLIRCS